MSAPHSRYGLPYFLEERISNAEHEIANQELGGKEPNMLIIDYHPGFQQIAFVDTETGELQQRLIATVGIPVNPR